MQVADRAMCFFENDYFLNILKTYKSETFPMLVPVIVRLAENHWHKILQESLIALKTILKEIDPVTFDESLKLSQADKKEFEVMQDPEERKRMDLSWAQLDQKLKAQDPSYVEPRLPFKADQLIKEYNELYAKIYDKEKFIQS